MNFLEPFWRGYGVRFSDQEERLVAAVLASHHQSVFRDNPSSVCVVNAAMGSGDLSKALAVALLTLGGIHAPLVDTTHFLNLCDIDRAVSKILLAGAKVPGWGGSWQTSEPDPIWVPVRDILRDEWPMPWARLNTVTAALAERGKVLQPNPSAYTAAAAIALGMPPPLAPWLFIAGRICGWAEIAARQIH